MSKSGKGKIEKICPICSKTFLVYPSGNSRIYCSQHCYGAACKSRWTGNKNPRWSGGLETRICIQCGHSYQIKSTSTQKFCSRKCWGKWKSANVRGDRHPGWKGGQILVECEYCQEEFLVYPYDSERLYCSCECRSLDHTEPRKCEVCGKNFRISKGRARAMENAGKFCSIRCRDIWRSINWSGEGGANWQGGKSFEPYPPEFNKRKKKLIRDRDSYKCAICKLWGNIVHHIDYCKDNCAVGNLITLCRSCHGVTGVNRDYWQTTLTNIMDVRYNKGVLCQP